VTTFWFFITQHKHHTTQQTVQKKSTNTRTKITAAHGDAAEGETRLRRIGCDNEHDGGDECEDLSHHHQHLYGAVFRVSRSAFSV